MQKNKLIAPFLKWVGGKRQIIPTISQLIPKNPSNYYEPFIGGGALLFHLQPSEAVVNDCNTELITVYEVIRDNVEELIEDLKKHNNEESYFYRIRAIDRTDGYKNLSKIEIASRVIFLNKTCYNGLYRVNSSGEFNSPFGKYKNPNIVNEITLRAVSKYLNSNNIKILNQDFEEALTDIEKGSFVYFDPPYDPISKSSNFTGYSHGGFNEEEQIRLRNLCNKIDNQGIDFLLSNSATPFILELYKDYNITFVKANRSINSVANKRGEIDEVLIRNYD
ncbi:Dam family site-specific DNA-(adenine-N6)-methyltransferase [Maribellus comscasis]|uniref:Site-specific DNA-methyltransferase (adenine-specific) n=1 Tax=Maribellus comscasis TaxID=2681766 RepID=A0A6I6JV75_9BACT|nr:DNA adenine methylase [Maribellus comscasis]QGY44087.1 Dam family site-specific DNA-(adenine-N6)-methyltransferase [Maribellus comscasis]